MMLGIFSYRSGSFFNCVSGSVLAYQIHNTRWCERNGYKNIVSQKKLTMELKQFGYKTERPYINGVQVRTYIDVKKEMN